MKLSEIGRDKRVDARIQQFYTKDERIHYLGLCKPDHSDCPYRMCGIRDGHLPPQRKEEK